MEVTIETYEPQPKQILYHKAPQRNKLFGGAMGGAKTRTLCEDVNWQMVKYPGNRGLLVRKVFNDFKISTYIILIEQVLKPYLEKNLIKENKQDKCFRYWNGSRLDYGGLQIGDGVNERERNKYFSTEYGVIAIDEAREITENEFKELGTRLRHRLPKDAKEYYSIDNLGEKRPPYHMLLASNPSQNWLKNRFILAPNSTTDIFIPALPKENKYNPPNYEEQLRELFKGDEKMIQAYVEGSWDAVGSIDDLLMMDDIQKSMSTPYANDSTISKLFTISDIARFGDDRTVIYDFKDLKVVNKEAYGKKDTMETVGRLQYHQQLNESSMIGVDVIATPGVYDRLYEIARALKEQGKDSFEVYDIDFRLASSEPEKFFNLRAEIYWYLRQMIKEQKCPVPDDPLLHGQLCSIKYKFVGGKTGTKIQIENKNDIKKRLGVSPDFADTYAMGIWLYQHVPVRVKKPRWIDDYKSSNQRQGSHMGA